ncbi:unnamed protein product [Blepharisma stoltei]|uniref:Tetrapyrrole biosynthesis uroporphyrinogen III synthase domain-containing protein n=1 Tax=Blepharisma stoltei TaxID=1481888 RepID=A0AAU9JQ82_9CILI|nr:unnamed protein product [Blepharisma stoltei]
MQNKTLLFFRNPDLSQDFISPLEQLGLSIICIPVLEFDYIKYEPNLRAAIHELSNEKGIIFPSPRAVIALSRSNQDLRHLKWYAVGESTAKACLEILGKTPEVIGTRGAAELADKIIEDQGPGGSFIYLGGDNQSTLPHEKYQKAEITIKEVCCYSTIPVGKESFLNSIQNIQPIGCVFFSPSGVKTATKHLADQNWNWGAVKTFAIGDTTATALRNNSEIARCDGVPTEFNLEGLKQVLIDYFSHN